jgi:hypothetical protein
MTPLERVEQLYRELVSHYGDAEDAGLRAAAKLLLVAIFELRRHGGAGWAELLDEYVQIAKQDPERFERMVEGNRTQPGWPDGANIGEGTDEGKFLC